MGDLASVLETVMMSAGGLVAAITGRMWVRGKLRRLRGLV